MYAARTKLGKDELVRSRSRRCSRFRGPSGLTSPCSESPPWSCLAAWRPAPAADLRARRRKEVPGFFQPARRAVCL